MSDELQERMTDMEVRFSFLNQQVDELNEIVTDCNLRIDRLQRENRALREMVASLSPSLEESPDE
jgi:SlyX protein